MQKHLCKIYNKVDYNFTTFVVSWCLQHVSNSVHDEQYMCSSCDKILQETSDENPVVPHYTKYPNAATGAKLSKDTESKTWICVHMLSSHVIL